MSKQCKIVEDLLPLYHDGICSEESSQMVEAHLAQCEACRKLLRNISDELVNPVEKSENIMPLKRIRKAVSAGKKRALIVGISIALSVMLVLFSGMSIWWYNQEYCYYIPFAEGHDPHSIYEFNQDGSIKQAVVTDAGAYTWYDSTYRYNVEIPVFLSRSGRAEMIRLDSSEAEHISVSISKWKGTKYVFHVSFSGLDHFWYDENGSIYWPSFIVDSNLNQYYPDHWTESIIAVNNAKFAEYEDQIRALVKDALAMWPFIG